MLADAGCPEFPDYVPSCGGTIADINSGRLTVAATKKLIEGLSPCKEPDADIANALMASFPRTRKGLAGEDLSPKLGSAVAFPGNWFKFAYTAPNRLDAAEDQQHTGFHGTHLECLHAILSTGHLLPSDPGLPGPGPLRIGAVSTCIGRSTAIWRRTTAHSPAMAQNTYL